MRVRLFVLFFALIFAIEYSSAQENCIGVLSGLPFKDSVSVFAKKAFIRKESNLGAAIIDSLPQGQWMKVLPNKYDALKMVSVSGYNSYWLPVSYDVDNHRKNGFVWSGSLALTDLTLGDKRFMLGMGYVATNKDAEEVVVNCLLLDNGGKQLWSQELEIGQDAVSVDAKIWDGLGLSNIQNIMRVMYSGEACGIPTYYKYFAWNGDRVITLPSRYNVSDAGIYYYEESLIFPSERGGKPESIIKKIEAAEYDENDKPIKKRTEQQLIHWDGEKWKTI